MVVVVAAVVAAADPAAALHLGTRVQRHGERQCPTWHDYVQITD
jgi:hypothetical protein